MITKPAAVPITKFLENLTQSYMTTELKERLLDRPVTFAVLGPLGVGKSTFSEVLGSKLGIPVIEERYMKTPILFLFMKILRHIVSFPR